MRWLAFMLCTIAALTLQTTLAPRLELFGYRPDGLLVMVVFFAMHAPVGDAAISAWIIGLCADLMTLERTGLIALTYTLVAVLIASLRDYFFRQSALTQFVVTLVTALLVRILWMIYRRSLYGGASGFGMDFAGECLVGSLYTAIWAPIVHGVLLSRSRWFGIVLPRYSHAGMPRWDRARV